MRPPREPGDPRTDGNAALEPVPYAPPPTPPASAPHYWPVTPARSEGTPTPPLPPARRVDKPGRRAWTDTAIALLSFVASLVLYGLTFGPELGGGITVLLLVHELGHFVVIRAKGLPAGLPVFIPFLGAYVAIRGMPQSVRDEAEIALAGPLVGGVGALACYAAYAIIGLHALLPLAYLGFALNLINLAPIAPLDGGRVARAFSPWFWFVGFLAAAGITIYMRSLLALIVAVLFGIQAMQSTGRDRIRSPYFRVSLGSRLYLATAYLALAVALGLATFAAHDAIVMRPPL